MAEEMSEIRKDIKELSIQVAVLSQKIDDLHIPKQPCDYFRDHISSYHKNTLGDQIKKQAISALITAIVLGSLAWLYLGAKQELQASTNKATVNKGP